MKYFHNKENFIFLTKILAQNINLYRNQPFYTCWILHKLFTNKYFEIIKQTNGLWFVIAMLKTYLD